MAPSILISIQTALDHLQSCLNKYGLENYESKKMEVGAISRLRCVRAFVICSTKLGINAELTTLWARLDGNVFKILDYEFSPDTFRDDGKRLFWNIEPFAEEINKWFIMLSDYDMQQHTLGVAFLSQVIEDLIGFDVENFSDSDVIPALHRYLVFLRDLIGFATLVCCDQHQEVQDLYSQVEAFAVRAAHYLLLHDFDIDEDKYNMVSIGSALLLRAQPFHDPQCCETYSKALACLKYCTELHVPTLHDPMTVMMDFIAQLLDPCCIMGERGVVPVNPSQSQSTAQVFDGLRFLELFYNKLPSMFHGKIREVTRVAICDAGVTIFSINQEDFDIDRGVQYFLGNMKVIQSEYEDKRLLNSPNPSWSFSQALLAFLDSILYECSKIHSDKLRGEPSIQLDLVFLRSLMGKLVESRKQQEDLHQDLWILAVNVAFKFEFLIHRLQEVRQTTECFSTLQSITADMNIIKTESFKIFQDNTIEEGDDDMQHPTLRVKLLSQVIDDLIEVMGIGYPNSSIPALHGYMKFLRGFIRFASLVSSDEHQEVQDLYSQVEASAVMAAHYRLLQDFDIDEDKCNMLKSMRSAFRDRAETFRIDPQCRKTYSKALACLRGCELLRPATLHDPMTVMMDFISQLLHPFYQFIETFDGLRSLEFFYNKLPSMFHGEIREVTRVAICDAGVAIFSNYQNDFVTGCRDFLGNMEVIQSEYEEKRLLNFRSFSQPLLAFLDSILDENSKIHSDTLRLEQPIQPDLIFLRSLVGKLVESRKQQEDLHQALWNLSVKVAFKFELLIHRLQELLIHRFTITSECYSMFVSITEDMNIIKTEEFKIFQDKTIEEDGGKPMYFSANSISYYIFTLSLSIYIFSVVAR